MTFTIKTIAAHADNLQAKDLFGIKLPATGPVPSPCVSVCVMDASSGYCQGCLRTLDEIAAWGQADDDTKRAVWAQLAQRAAKT